MSIPTPRAIPATRLGGWLPKNPRHTSTWIRRLRKAAAERSQELTGPIQAFQDMVYANPVLYASAQMMFSEAAFYEKSTPLGWEPEVKTFEEFLHLLNTVMTTAPECFSDGSDPIQPAGLIGFPINALLDWAMATSAGYSFFSNALVNQQFKQILCSWSQYLVTQNSCYVLRETDPARETLPWLGDTARKWMIAVANAAVGRETLPQYTNFEQIFQCDPSDIYYGFHSWDDFFTRRFVQGVRPVSEPENNNIIVNACESAPYALVSGVPRSAQFWLKDQPYSLEHMLAWDDELPQFVGGTVYQAFLSALSYHRWHSPVSGRIHKVAVVTGSYYLENMYQSFMTDNPDRSAPNNSQGFLTAVATRALIFIEADNPAIGLMCVMPVGMAEVSSCEITVRVGQHVKKGDPLGMFHFGGSTHCLFFRPEVKLTFDLYNQTPGPQAETNIRVNTAIAYVQPDDIDATPARANGQESPV